MHLPDLRQRPAALLPVLLLVLLVLLPWWRLAVMQGVIITDDIFASDIMNDAFPYRLYLGEALRNGELPLWYPPVYGGFPLLARAEAGAAYPLNILFFGLLPPYVALNLTILSTLLVAAAGMYLLARELGAGAWPAVLGGTAFAFSGFMVAHLKHLSTVNAGCWLPLGVFLLERGLAARPGEPSRKAALPLLAFAAVFGMQNLSGHTQTAYYCGLLYLAYAIFRLSLRAAKPQGKKTRSAAATPAVEHRAWYRDRRLAWLGASFALAAGVSAVQLLPTYELVSQSQRAGGVSFAYASQYAYDPANAVNLVVPYARGDIGNGTYRGEGIFWEDYGYAGLVTLLLAAFAVVALRKEPHVRFFAVAAAAAFLLVLGPNTPLYELVFTVVPGMKFFRFPTRFLLVVNAALCLLAALGAQQLAVRKGARVALALLALVWADLVYHQMRQNPVIGLDRWSATPATAAFLQRDSSLFRIYSVGGKETHQSAFAAARGWQGDLTPYVEQREFLQPSLQVLYGLSSADGYAQLTPSYVVDVWGDQNRGGLIYKAAALQQGVFRPRAAFVNILGSFNVKYLLSPWPVESPLLPLEAKIGPVFVHRNAAVLPRARMVGAYRLARTAAETEADMLDEAFDPRREAILAETPSPAPAGDHAGSTVTVTAYRANSVALHVRASSPGVLVLADTWYPGWRAFVDGAEQPVLRANSSQRAVALEAGEHDVRFSFDSAPARAGMWITGLSLLLLAAAGGIVRQHRIAALPPGGANPGREAP